MKPWYEPDISTDKLSVNILAQHLLESNSLIVTECRTWGFGHLLKEPYVYLARRRLYPQKYNQQKNILLKYRLWGNSFLAELLKSDFILFDDNVMNDVVYTVAKKYKELTFSVEDSCSFEEKNIGKDLRDQYHRYINRQRLVYEDMEKYEESFNTPAILSLPEHYKEDCDTVLRLLGINDCQWFVVMHVAEKGPAAYRYNAERRHVFSQFLEMAEHITATGGVVLRLGHPSIEPLNLKNSRIIDYAHWPYRTPFSDMAVISKCRYMVNVMSGPQTAPQVMGKPQIMCNWMPLMCMGVLKNEIMLTLNIYHKKTKRLLSFQDMIKQKVGYKYFLTMNGLCRPELFSEEFELIPNTSTELCNAVDEMHVLLNNQNSTRSRRQELQREIFGGDFFYTKGEVSDSFLQKNDHLLA